MMTIEPPSAPMTLSGSATIWILQIFSRRPLPGAVHRDSMVVGRSAVIGEKKD